MVAVRLTVRSNPMKYCISLSISSSSLNNIEEESDRLAGRTSMKMNDHLSSVQHLERCDAARHIAK